MKKMTPLAKSPKRTMSGVTTEKHEQMIRRAANQNVHVITAHGTVHVGRKGRGTGKSSSSGPKG